MILGRRGGLDQFFAADVVAVLVSTDELAAVALRDLLGQELPAALRARLGDWLVPEREIALRVVGAPVEHLAPPRFALDDVAAVLRTQHAHGLLFDVLALGITRAGGELPESALLHDEITAAV